MPDSNRTFIGIAVPDLLGPRLQRLQRGLAETLPTARWAETPPFHLTLAFLGDVPHADLSNVCRAVADAAAPFAAFELTLSGIGAFPDVTRARVMWTGVEGPGLQTLRELQAAVAAAVDAVGYPAEGPPPFHAHVTLARFQTGARKGVKVPPPDLTSVVRRRESWSAGPFVAGEVVTFASSHGREGQRYDRLAHVTLKSRKGRENP